MIQIATDHAEYFEQIKAHISQKNHVLREIEFVPAAGVVEGEYVGTNYERKYVRQRRRVYTIAVMKIMSES
jgi:tRNA G46 methylase TrmB